MKKTMIAALLGATLLTGGAVAAVQNDTQPQDAPKPHMMRDPMMMADTNKDGVVTRDETIASVTAHFTKLDTNKDGKITAEERQAARAAMGRGMGKRMRGPDDAKRMRGPDGERGTEGPGMKRGPDANGDGMVTLDEQRAQALKRFDFVDRNGDGKADQAERELVRDMLREMGAGGGNGRGHRSHGPNHGGHMPPPPPAAPVNGS
ncbi:MAG: ca2+ sensor protein [Sphingomonadales bacterium]|nr:MAG: ca2+ sensor protein [Sphingomonadales bacterium]